MESCEGLLSSSSWCPALTLVSRSFQSRSFWHWRTLTISSLQSSLEWSATLASWSASLWSRQTLSSMTCRMRSHCRSNPSGSDELFCHNACRWRTFLPGLTDPLDLGLLQLVVWIAHKLTLLLQSWMELRLASCSEAWVTLEACCWSWWLSHSELLTSLAVLQWEALLFSCVDWFLEVALSESQALLWSTWLAYSSTSSDWAHTGCIHAHHWVGTWLTCTSCKLHFRWECRRISALLSTEDGPWIESDFVLMKLTSLRVFNLTFS